MSSLDAYHQNVRSHSAQLQWRYIGGKQISKGVSYVPTSTCFTLITKDHCEQCQIDGIERLSHLPFGTIEMKMVGVVKLVTSFMTTSKTRKTSKLTNKTSDVSPKA